MITAATERQIGIDVRLQRQRRIQHPLDALLALLIDRFLDAMGVGCRLLHDVIAHLLLAAHERHVVVGKIRVPQHMGDHQGVFLDAVGIDQVGMVGIAGKHHLENPRVTHAMLDHLVYPAHAKGPVRHPHREAIHGHLHHETGRHHLEIHRVIDEPLRGGQGFQLRNVLIESRRHLRRLRCGLPDR